MLKKCPFLFILLAVGMASAAATMTPVTPSKDGNCYQIGTAAELYGFAAIVNGTDGHTAEPAACGVLTADIVVNENVLSSHVDASTGSWTGYAPSYDWTPIGTSTNMFQGTFDGLGHTISGLFNNNTSSATKYIGLFGYVSGTNATVSIKNVGVEDSYFRGNGYSGGIVGTVSGGSSSVLSLENVFSSSVLCINGNYVGGLIGYVAANWTMNITNAYNSGSIFGTGTFDSKYYAGLVGYISSSATVSIKNAFNYGNLPSGSSPLVYVSSTVYSVENSFYLGSAAQGKDKYGLSESLIEFSNGTVLGLLRQGENGSAWKSGSDHPILFVKHSATLHYSTGVETIYFVEGYAKSLPTIDKSGNPVLGWYDNEGLTGTKYTEIPASANSDLSLYPKVMKLVGGCYEISDADMLYAFAAAVNNGNAIACGKLTANIVVNQNVLTTADGTSNVSSSGEYIGSNSASFRQWTPIGYNYRPFKGTFNGQGHTISGLYFNDPSSSDVGLFSSVFGDPKPVTIENVGLVDSYFRGNSSVGGLVGNAKGLVTIKNSFNAGSINAQGEIFGGLVGYSWKSSADVVKLTISNSYNTGSLNGGSYGGGLVGSAVDLIISNSYNTGSVTVSKTNLENGDVNCVGGFAASADKVTITNSYNYGSVSSPDGARKDDFVTSINDGSTVTNSFFISECDFEGNGATKMSSTEFADGTVFAALRSAEDGEVWHQYSGDVYPTFVEKNGTDAPSPMHVAVLHYSETDVEPFVFVEGATTLLPTTLSDGSIVVGWYKSDDLSGDAYTKIAATENGDLNFYAKAMKLDSDGYYEIADADMLFKFAELVNTQNSTYGSAKAKLTADIVVNQNVLGANNANVNADGSYNNAQAASAFSVWTPIGNSSNPFKGSFNGQGHTISGLYFNNSDADNVGLFGYTSGAVIIDSVGVVDSYFQGGKYVGSIVGFAMGSAAGKLSLKNSYNIGVVKGTDYVGGLVGGNNRSQSFNVENSYNSGSVNGTKYVGGLIGNPGDIKFSYNVGSVTGTSYVGGLAGSGNSIGYSYNAGPVKNGEELGNAMMGYAGDVSGVSSKISNSYYLEGSGADCGPNAFSRNSKEFANGAVALALRSNSSVVTGASIWGQVVGTDKTPTLTGEIVFPITLDNSDNCYEISNADDLYIFAAIVNSGFKSDACGKLTENIVVNENVLTSAGELNTAPVGGFKEWTPIGFGKNSFGQDISFRGTFHGQGHTISGLYFNDTDVEDVGLFGDVSGTVTIDGVGLVDSYIGGKRCVGGLVGFASGSLTISNSYNASSVNTPGSGFGGLVGAAGGIYDGEELIERGLLTISNSYNEGSLNGGYWGGGLVGYADALVVSNSYNAGSVYISGSGEDAHVGGITSSVDNASTVTNSYNYGEINYPTENSVSKDDLVAEGGEGIVIVTNSFSIGTSRFEGDGSTKMSSTQFADGTVYAALHSAEGGEVWKQYENDAYPTFVKKSGTTFEPNAEGFYEIATVEQLYEFAAIVNNGMAVGSGTELGVKAKLIADICVNACGEGESVLGTDNANIDATTGAYTGSTTGLREWIPIGNFDHPFIGTFDGQGHTISGLYFNAPDEPNVGLFGYVSGEDVTVSIGNVGVEDSYFNAQSAVGGVIGYVGYVALNIKNVYNAAVVVGAYEAGGIVGSVNLDVQTLSMVNVYNVGSISGTEETDGKTGGLVGYFMNDLEESKVTIKNSYNYGNVVGGDPLVGKVENDYEGYVAVMVTNSFYLGSSISGDYGEFKSATDFSNGTVYAALHSAEGGEDWLQYAGDAYPTLVEKTGTGAPAPMHVAVLHYSETDSVVIAYTEGTAFTLPAEDKEGKALSGWTTSEDGTGDVLTEIPATATTDLKLYPKLFAPNAEGFYEIATVKQLYEFAAIVNNGTVPNAKAKLVADIVVNEHVLADANGVSKVNSDGTYIGDASNFREWTPIGNSTNKFQGTFDGQGHTISGLYFNKADAQYVGLFGVLSTATIKNVGVEDSYFKGFNYIGGILGLVDEYANVNIENVYNAAVVVSEDCAGGVIGGDFGNESHVTNAYNVGMVLSIKEAAGGIVGYNYSVEPTTIQNSFNYGTVSAGSGTAGALIGEVADKDDAAGFSVTNSYYLGDAANGGYGEYKSASDFENGTVLAALRDGEGGYVWVQAEGDKYPTIDVNASTNAKTIVLDWTSADDSTTLADAGYTDGAMVIVKDGKQFYAGGAIYEGILSAGQVAAIGSNKLYPISGVELETVDGKLVAILDGRDREEGGTAPAIMIPFDLVVDKVFYKRKMIAGIYQTVMLPFNVDNLKLDAYSNYGFYRFTSMDENVDGYRYMAMVYRVRLLYANMPYIMKNIGETDTEGIVFEGDGRITLNTVSSGSREFSATSNDSITWSMKGVYENKVWETGDPEIGSAYLFAGQKKDGYKIGEYAKLGAGASLQPMRMYLLKGALAQLNRPGMFGSVDHYGSPESIGVRFVDDEEFDEGEETMVEKRITVIPTVIKSNRWFDMKGRALDSKPTAKGNYYYNGKRITIK